MNIPFEVGPRAESSDALVNTIAKYFGLGDIIIYQDLGGAYNLNVRVHTASGAYIIRVYRPWVTYDRLMFLHQVKKALSAANLPVSEPLGMVPAHKVGLYPNRQIELERFIPHDGVTDNWPRYKMAFSKLGQLHQVLATQVGPSAFISPQVQNYGLPTTLLAWLEQTKQTIGQAEPRPVVSEALAICEETRDLLEAIQLWWQQVGQHLPIQPNENMRLGSTLLLQVAHLLWLSCVILHIRNLR